MTESSGHSNHPLIYFFVSGWGLGHATRTHALINELVRIRPTVAVTIFTWGRAINYFSDETPFTVVPLQPYLKAEDSLYEMSATQLLKTVFRWFSIWRHNGRTVLHTYKTNRLIHRPAVAVFDSDFHFSALIGAPVFRVALSQTAFILEHWKLALHGTKKTTWLTRLFLWEILEHLVQKIAFHYVICPRLDRRSFLHGKTLHTGPIVRSSFRKTFPNVSHREAIGWLGSGSIASNSIKQVAMRLNIHAGCNTAERGFNYSIDKEGRPVIDYFDSVISQGGYSTISELVVRRKPSFLIPAPGSPEQKINVLFCQRNFCFLKTANREDSVDLEIAEWRQTIGSEQSQPQEEQDSERGETIAANFLCKLIDKSAEHIEA